jgi:hypothetical protein
MSRRGKRNRRRDHSDDGRDGATHASAEEIRREIRDDPESVAGILSTRAFNVFGVIIANMDDADLFCLVQPAKTVVASTTDKLIPMAVIDRFDSDMGKYGHKRRQGK